MSTSYTRHSARHLKYFISFKPHNNLAKKQRFKRLTNLPKDTHVAIQKYMHAHVNTRTPTLSCGLRFIVTLRILQG